MLAIRWHPSSEIIDLKTWATVSSAHRWLKLTLWWWPTPICTLSTIRILLIISSWRSPIEWSLKLWWLHITIKVTTTTIIRILSLKSSSSSILSSTSLLIFVIIFLAELTTTETLERILLRWVLPWRWKRTRIRAVKISTTSGSAYGRSVECLRFHSLGKPIASILRCVLCAFSRIISATGSITSISYTLTLTYRFISTMS